MPERLGGRRQFVQDALLGFTYGVAAGEATVIYAGHLYAPRFEDTKGALDFISEEAVKFQDALSFVGFDTPKGPNQKIFTPNREAFAQSILQVAYIDGGVGGVIKAREHYLNRGLIIQTRDLDRNAAQVVFRYKKPLLMEIDTQLLLESEDEDEDSITDLILFHEMSHLSQETRNPVFNKTLNLAETGVTVGLGITSVVLLGQVAQYKKTGTLTRRKFFENIVASATVGGLAYLSPFISPSELQAYTEMLRFSYEGSMDNRFGTLFDITE